MESSHFWPLVLHDSLYKTLFFDFWSRPPNAQNLIPKICTKSPISRLVWQIDRICLGLPGGFRDGRFNGTMQNVVGPTVVAMATKFGLGAEIQSPTDLYLFIIHHKLVTAGFLWSKSSLNYLNTMSTDQLVQKNIQYVFDIKSFIECSSQGWQHPQCILPMPANFWKFIPIFPEIYFQ